MPQAAFTPLDCLRRFDTVTRVTRHKTTHPRPSGHVLVPSAAIGGLAVILVAGLDALGFLDRTNERIAQWVSRNGAETFPKQLPEWALWLGTVLFAFGLAIAILSTPGLWRRGILWITSMALVAAWAPVLGIAAHAPEISGTWIAAFWSGFCAMVYTANHRMACDESPAPPHDPS